MVIIESNRNIRLERLMTNLKIKKNDCDFILLCNCVPYPLITSRSLINTVDESNISIVEIVNNSIFFIHQEALRYIHAFFIEQCVVSLRRNGQLIALFVVEWCLFFSRITHPKPNILSFVLRRHVIYSTVGKLSIFYSQL